MTRRTNWGGSIATFIVVTAVLLVGMIGAMYILNQRGKQARSESQTATTSSDKGKTDNKKPSSNSTNNNTGNKSTSNTNNGQLPGGTPTELGQSGYLPQTGPSASPFEMLGVFALSTTTIAYVVSRRDTGNSSLT